MDYSRLSDNEIILRIHQKDDEAMEYMMQKYGYLVKRETRTAYLIGAETDDLTQEGMIGLFKAIRDYNSDKGASFSTFAVTCIRRQIQNAITSFNRKKHSPLNTYVSFYVNMDDGDSFTLEDVLSDDNASNPETLVIARERMQDLNARMEEELSPLEQKVIQLYLSGLSYGDIAVKLGKTEKAVDNALHRIRVKLSNK